MTHFAREKRPTSRLRWTAAAIAITALGAMPTASWAQDAQPVFTPEITITGSKIKGVDTNAFTPVSVMTAADIAKTKASSIEDVLRSIPAADFTGGLTSNSNNGGVGASEAGLRNLGPTRTLVLVNGFRFVATDTEGSATAVDLNSIPLAMVERIEVLQNGAGAIYGADAVAGVINIITKKHASGVNAYADLGGTTHGDGFQYNIGSTLGANFEHGNVLMNLGFDNRDPIKQIDRGWSSDQYIGNYEEALNASSKLPVLTGKIGGAGPTLGFLAGGQTIALSNPASVNAIPYTFYSPANGRSFFNLPQFPDLTSGLQRKTFNATGHLDVTDDIVAVFEGFYTNRTSQQQLNAEPLSSTITTGLYPGLTIPATNIYNPYGVAITGANFRPVAIGPREYSQDVNTYRFRAGLEGVIHNDYNWEAGYVYGISQATNQTANSINFYHLGQETGQFACPVPAITSGCHQANFFNGYNTLTTADINYLAYTDTRDSQLTQDYFYANIGGPVYDLPAGAIKGSVGFERRQETEFDHPDSVRAAGEADSDAQPTQGGYSVYSTYAELNIPLVKDVFLVKDLTAALDSRYDVYSNFGHALTWQGSLHYSVNDDVTFRGNIGTGFRAPSVKELYGGKFQNFPSTTLGDPCDTGNGGAGIYAGSGTCNAALTKVGINPATYVSQLNAVPNPQYPTSNGGNPGLRPETSQSLGIGVVFTPKEIDDNLSFSIDYYSIFIRNAITYGLDPTKVATLCYGPTQNKALCNLITRSSTTGDIVDMNLSNLNFGYEKTDGIEFATDYAITAARVGLPLDGIFRFTGKATYLMHDTTLNPDMTINQQAGTFSVTNGSAEPKWKAYVAADYEEDSWSFHYDARYLAGVKNIDESTYIDPNTGNYTGNGDYNGNAAVGILYHDISATYNWKNMKFTLGVDNLLDKDPPFIAGDISSANGLSAAGYDFIGRFVYTKVTANF